MIGTTLHHYLVTALLGSGGMGEVFRARDVRLNRDVAVKVLPPEFASHNERLQRFQQEARTLAALNHPNVLAIYDTGIHENTPYLVRELLEGRTLREELQGGALTTGKATEYALQIAHGLAAAHSKGVIHRDLKPENIFVTTDGRVKLLDFGLAKVAENQRSDCRDVERTAVDANAGTVVQKTEPGRVMGTPGYMSPEQVRGDAADQRTDIFALGTILYEMFSGKHPFRRRTIAETMTAILNDQVPELSGAVGNLPPHGHHWHSHYFMAMGQANNSLEAAQQALALEPFDFIINIHLGWHYLFVRDYDNALVQLQKTRELFPKNPLSHRYLGLVYEKQRRYDESVAEFKEALALSKSNSIMLGGLGYTYEVQGETNKALSILSPQCQSARNRRGRATQPVTV